MNVRARGWGPVLWNAVIWTKQELTAIMTTCTGTSHPDQSKFQHEIPIRFGGITVVLFFFKKKEQKEAKGTCWREHMGEQSRA